MRKPSRRLQKVLAAATTPAAIVAAVAMVYQASSVAFRDQTRDSSDDSATESVTLTDDDSDSARFQVSNMVPGDRGVRCIKVTARATGPSTVKGYAVSPVVSTAGLEDHILVTIKDGDGGSFEGCAGFVPDNTIVPAAPLSTIVAMDSYDAGIGGWRVSAGTSVKVYQLTWEFDTSGLTQAQVDDLQGTRTGLDMQWEMRGS